MTGRKKLLETALHEAAAIFPHPSPECGILCDELGALLGELQNLTGKDRRRVVIQIAVLERYMRMLGCLPCPFE